MFLLMVPEIGENHVTLLRTSLTVCLAPIIVWGFACTNGESPTGTKEGIKTGATAASAYQPVAKFLDGELLRFGKMFPNFGGLWVDGDDTVVISVTSEINVPEISVAARGLVSSTGRFDNTTVRVEPADYSFASLFEWKSQLVPNIDLESLVFVDIDEKQNNLFIAVLNSQAVADVRRTAADLKVPTDAVVVEVQEPFRRMDLLKDHVRPIAGGLGMLGTLQEGSTIHTRTCSLGFMAKRSGLWGLVTNSHCTVTQGGVEETDFWQNTNDDPAKHIAVESADPYYIGLPGCPEGSFCRWSDSAFAKLWSVWYDPGKLKRTSALGSTTIVGTWTIVGEASYPFVDETVNKVGFATGWTQGQVTRTCVDDFASDSKGHLCQDIASAGVNPGDSGSPVFRVVDGNNVILYGVVWAGGSNAMVFSAMGNIEQELGNLETAF